MKKWWVILVVLTIISTPYSLFAQEAASPSQSVIDVGNKFCPVSGDEVSGKHFVVYEGKRYGMCCPMCQKDFKKNPEKYVSIVNAQMASGETADEVQEHDGQEHAGHADLH